MTYLTHLKHTHNQLAIKWEKGAAVPSRLAATGIDSLASI